MIGGVWYLTYNTETGNQHIRDFIYDGVLYGEEESAGIKRAGCLPVLFY